MSKRYDRLGIKQTIQKHWMDYVVKMMLAGLSKKEIRAELDEFLAREKPYTGNTPKTHSFIKSMLSSWYSPDKDLIDFRDHSFELIRHEPPQNWIPYHWAVISASYPFWFNVAMQVGRLLNLQDKITKQQISIRLREIYGDRESVWHYAQYVIRSFIAWGVLADSKVKGCYEQSKIMGINDQNLAILLYESALHANSEGKATLELLKNNPAFFPFQLPVLTGDFISQHSNAIDVVHCGLSDELLKLRN